MNNLKELIISDLKTKEIERYKNEIEKKLEEEKSSLELKPETLKYDYKGKSKLKVFVFDLLNHGFTSKHFNFLSFVAFMLTMSTCIGWIMFTITNATIEAFPKTNIPFGISILAFLLNIGLFLVMLLILACTHDVIISNMYDKIKEYRELESIEIEIDKAEKFNAIKLKDIENLFEKEKERSYTFNDPVSKEVLKETIEVLSEERVKSLLRSGNGDSIRYQDLIIKIKEIEEEKDLSEIYEKMKKNS